MWVTLACYPVVARRNTVEQHRSEQAANILRGSGRDASLVTSTCLVGEWQFAPTHVPRVRR